MVKLFNKIRNRFFAGIARQQDVDRLYDQINGLLQIQNAMEGKNILRPLRGWAISPDAMSLILADLQSRESPSVVEFGSGQSTIIFAAALRHRNGRLISVEHDSEYAVSIKQQLAVCGLSERVRFLHAPLKDMMGQMNCRSYDLNQMDDAAADVVLVDGPPWHNGLLTRLVPLRWAVKHSKPGCAVFLDDSAREPEKACVAKLIDEFPNLRVIPHNTEKGLMELRLV
jgi:predicted O-methyltransferase YrrM